MEDKLEKILKNQEILNKNQLIIYSAILENHKTPSKEFLLNYLADIAGETTSLIALEKIFKNCK